MRETNSMSNTETVEVLRSWLAALESGDVERLLSLQSDDATWILPGSAKLPWAGTWKGNAEARQCLDKLYGALEVEKQEPEEFIAEGARVVVIGNEIGISKPAGRKWNVQYAWAFTVEDGRVTRWEAFEKTEAIAACYS